MVPAQQLVVQNSASTSPVGEERREVPACWGNEGAPEDAKVVENFARSCHALHALFLFDGHRLLRFRLAHAGCSLLDDISSYGRGEGTCCTAIATSGGRWLLVLVLVMAEEETCRLMGAGAQGSGEKGGAHSFGHRGGEVKRVERGEVIGTMVWVRYGNKLSLCGSAEVRTAKAQIICT